MYCKVIYIITQKSHFVKGFLRKRYFYRNVVDDVISKLCKAWKCKKIKRKSKKGIDKPKEMRYNIQAHPKRGRGRDTETDELVESFFKKLKKRT